MRACWLKWVGRDWSISADYIWLNYSGANTARPPKHPFKPHPNQKLLKTHPKLPQIYTYLN